jgi:hypothetical protein
MEKTYLAAQIPQRTNLYLKTEVCLISLFLSPILEAESGCKDTATFSNFQIFLKKFLTFFFEEPNRSCISFLSESGCKGKATF